MQNALKKAKIIHFLGQNGSKNLQKGDYKIYY